MPRLRLEGPYVQNLDSTHFGCLVSIEALYRGRFSYLVGRVQRSILVGAIGSTSASKDIGGKTRINTEVNERNANLHPSGQNRDGQTFYLGNSLPDLWYVVGPLRE